MNEIQRRVAAMTKTKERFEGKPFDWSKAATCIHLMRYHASNMGYEPPIVPRFRTANGAIKALKKQGVDTLPDLMDKYFTRIAPAQMAVGDIAVFPGEDGIDALYVYGQLRAFLGWFEGFEECQFIRMSDEGYRLCKGAWRL